MRYYKMNRAKELAEEIAEEFLHHTGGPKGWASEFNIYGTQELYNLDGPYWKLFGEVLQVADEVLKERKDSSS
jgi:hypothetical protein